MNKWAYFGKKVYQENANFSQTCQSRYSVGNILHVLWKNLPQIMSLHIKSATYAIEYWKICHKHNLNAWNLPHKL